MTRDEAKALLLGLYPNKDVGEFEAALVVVGLDPRIAVAGCSDKGAARYDFESDTVVHKIERTFGDHL